MPPILVTSFEDTCNEVAAELGLPKPATVHDINSLLQWNQTKFFPETAHRLSVMNAEGRENYLIAMHEKARGFLMIATAIDRYISKCADELAINKPPHLGWLSESIHEVSGK